MFLQVSVILLTGGVSASLHAGIHPPGSRHPPGKQTPAYGQRASGTHPTGMHSCFKECFWKCFTEKNCNGKWQGSGSELGSRAPLSVYLFFNFKQFSEKNSYNNRSGPSFHFWRVGAPSSSWKSWIRRSSQCCSVELRAVQMWVFAWTVITGSMIDRHWMSSVD